MISTATMIQLGRVKGSDMVHVRPSNNKLTDRGAKMISRVLSISVESARELFLRYGSVQLAIDSVHQENDTD